jgi:hypothetical protein
LQTIDLVAADPGERGAQYGEAARAEIERSVAFYAQSVARATGLPWAEVVSRAPRWVPLVEEGLAQPRLDGTTVEAVERGVRSTMTDHFGHPNAVCQHSDPRRHELDRNETIASSLVDLTMGSYRLTPGLPCSNSYQQAPWNLYDGPGPQDRPDVPAPALSLAGRD